MKEAPTNVMILPGKERLQMVKIIGKMSMGEILLPPKKN